MKDGCFAGMKPERGEVRADGVRISYCTWENDGPDIVMLHGITSSAMTWWRVAPIVAQQLNGRQNEIGEGMAQIYASEFTEQELKDLVTFYKSPLGKKLIEAEPRAIGLSMAFMNSWAQNFADTVMGAFRAEMRKRGKEI